MTSSYATLGDATGDILGSLLGGGNPLENQKAAKSGAQAAESAINARKLSIESQQIMDEIERARRAQVSGRDIARAQGNDVGLYDQYTQGLDTGSYGVPVSDVGPIDTSKPPPELTDQVMRQFQQADLTSLAKQMSGTADTNASAIMDTLVKASGLTRTSAVDLGRMPAKDLAVLEASQAGKDLTFDNKIAQQNADTSQYSARKATDMGNYVAAKARQEDITLDQAWAKYGRDASGGNLLTMADVSSSLKLALPGLDTEKYGALSIGPGGKAAADAYMIQSVSEMKDPANSLTVLKLLVPDPSQAEPAVQALIRMMEGQVAQKGTVPPAEVPPGRVVVDYTQPGAR